MGKLKLMIFDCDMTIVDSSYAITENFKLIADAVGRPHVTRDRVMRDIALPLPQLCEAFLGEYRPEWREVYLKNTDIVEPKLLRPFPDAASALAQLKGMGVTLAMASNREDPRPGMERVGLAPLFDAMTGANGLTGKDGRPGPRLAYKPDPAMLNALLEYFKVPAEEAAYVGDAAIDIETARASGVRGIGITYGNLTEEQFLALGAWRVVNSLSELPGLVEAP